MANGHIDNCYIQLRLVPFITVFLNINFNFNYNNIKTYQCNIPVLYQFLFTWVAFYQMYLNFVICAFCIESSIYHYQYIISILHVLYMKKNYQQNPDKHKHLPKVFTFCYLYILF